MTDERLQAAAQQSARDLRPAVGVILIAKGDGLWPLLKGMPENVRTMAVTSIALAQYMPLGKAALMVTDPIGFGESLDADAWKQIVERAVAKINGEFVLEYIANSALVRAAFADKHGTGGETDPEKIGEAMLMELASKIGHGFGGSPEEFSDPQGFVAASGFTPSSGPVFSDLRAEPGTPDFPFVNSPEWKAREADAELRDDEPPSTWKSFSQIAEENEARTDAQKAEDLTGAIRTAIAGVLGVDESVLDVRQGTAEELSNLLGNDDDEGKDGAL